MAVSRTAPELESLVAQIRSEGGQALAHPGDLREPDVSREVVAAAVKAHGRLQVLVNNAGVGSVVNLADTSDAEWDRILATNLTAVFRLTRAALPHLAQGGGHVFMISSLAGRNPIAGMAAYCASKAALDQLAACLMQEVRHQGVKVTVIAPGSVSTGFRAGGGGGEATWKLQPEDVAGALLDLIHTRDGAHLSRVEMRPARPPKT
jgi:short-subunit dehydrogenase